MTPGSILTWDTLLDAPKFYYHCMVPMIWKVKEMTINVTLLSEIVEPQKEGIAKNRPISPKKQKHDESQKLKKIITKTVNAAMEDDLRAQALDGKRSLRVRKEAAPAPAPKQTKKKGKK
uniref:Uncharacterized protein n=1 Tax=Timema tahoe TaxID=61484 RepID=A0A7R9FJF6_9NEOP|nr:unnamed protein product [Timema tahoe]